MIGLPKTDSTHLFFHFFSAPVKYLKICSSEYLDRTFIAFPEYVKEALLRLKEFVKN